MNQRDLASYDAELDEIDLQIIIMKEKKAEIQRERDQLIPNGLDLLMSSRDQKPSMKRKAAAIEDEESFKEIKKILLQSSNKLEGENDENILDNLTLEEKSAFKKIKPSRKVYSEETKKLTIELTSKFSQRKVAAATQIPLTNIKRWTSASKEGKISSKRGRRITYPDLEEELIKWVKQQRAQKNHISVKRFLKESRKRAQQSNKTGLKFTWGWANAFFKRNGFKLRKPTTKVSSPQDLTETIKDFTRKIAILVHSGIYDCAHVVNVDETSINFETISYKTIVDEAEEGQAAKHPITKSVGKDKDNLTVVLAASWTGAKLKATIIFPDKGKKKLDRDIPHNIWKFHREDGPYMDRDVMKSWISNVLAPYARKFQSNKKGLLILDNFKGHISKDIIDTIKKLNYDVEALPPNTTKYLQPLDISVNKPFKTYISDEWEAYAASLNEKDVTKAGNYLAPSRGVRMVWVSRAWLKINTEVIANGFNVYKNYNIVPISTSIEEKKELVEELKADQKEAPKEIGDLYKDPIPNEESNQIIGNKYKLLEKNGAENKETGSIEKVRDKTTTSEKVKLQSPNANESQEIENLCNDLDVYFDISDDDQNGLEVEEDEDDFPLEFEGKGPSDLLDFEILHENEHEFD